MARKRKSPVPTGFPADCPVFLESLKCRMLQAQVKAMLSVNRDLMQLYWDIGGLIVERQERDGWGESVVDRMAGDIQKAFPGIRDFSPSNVSRMRAFFLANARVQQNSAQPVPNLADKNSAQVVPKLAEKKLARLKPSTRSNSRAACATNSN